MRKPNVDVLLTLLALDGETTADALEAVRPQGTVVIVGMGKLESNINTYLINFTKEINF